MYIYLSRKIKVSVVSVMALTVFIYSYGNLNTFYMLLSAVIHEFGHLTVTKLCGLKARQIRITLGGADIMTSGITSYKNDFFIFSGGIIANILSFLLFAKTPFGHYCLAYAILNCMPCEGLDGGRALYSLLYPRIKDKADIICKLLSFAVLFLLWQISVYLLFKTGENFSLFLFCTCIFASMADENEKGLF